MGVVYAIRCEVSGKQYIGSTVDLRRRQGRHELLLSRGLSNSTTLQKAWDKHGAGAFTIRVLETVADGNFLRAREQAWIWRLKPRYNCRLVVGQPPKNKWSPEQRAAMSARVSGSKHPQFGKKQTGERLENSRAQLLAFRQSGAPHPMQGHQASDELRAKRAENARKLWADPEYRAKSIAVRLGHAWNKGYKHTPEQIEANRQRAKIAWAKRRAGDPR